MEKLEKQPQQTKKERTSKDVDKLLKRMKGKGIPELKKSLRRENANERFLAVNSLIDKTGDEFLGIIQENEYLINDFDPGVRIQIARFINRLWREEPENNLAKELIEKMKDQEKDLRIVRELENKEEKIVI